MSTHQAAPIQKQNRLLAKLPPDELERLHPHLEIVSLSLGQEIIQHSLALSRAGDNPAK